MLLRSFIEYDFVMLRFYRQSSGISYWIVFQGAKHYRLLREREREREILFLVDYIRGSEGAHDFGRAIHPERASWR